MDRPWLSIIGLGEDGLDGLPLASREALGAADVVFGGARHLALAGAGARGREWPVPFDIAPVLALRGQRVAVLASGDPFWFGAGAVLAAALPRDEWVSYPAPSCFALAAGHLGWRLEETLCLGLHAAPLSRLRPVLAEGARAIMTLRDGAAVAELTAWLVDHGHGASDIWVMEALGGPRARVRGGVARDFSATDIAAPVVVAISARGRGISRASGLPDDAFAHDGQITKRAVRAITLSTLSPQPDELLWDFGAGSGSISVEWCLAGGRAVAVERRADRAANIARNIETFGLSHRMALREGDSAAVLPQIPAPNAVFVGGGGDGALFAAIRAAHPQARIVANAVTLEGEALLAQLHAQWGGALMRIDLAESAPLGGLRGWQAARPVVQWSFVP